MTENFPILERVGRTDETKTEPAFLPSATGLSEPSFNFILQEFSSYVP